MEEIYYCISREGGLFFNPHYHSGFGTKPKKYKNKTDAEDHIKIMRETPEKWYLDGPIHCKLRTFKTVTTEII